jgi:uncharacterized phage-associated protein
MARVEDVATYILEKRGRMTAMKLQKLVYYCQAWSLVWDEAPMFDTRIEAWANGPVSPELYARHRGGYEVASVGGDASALSENNKLTIDAVLQHYGDKTSQYLSELTHREDPWSHARRRAGLKPGERGSVEITNEKMAEYYSSLL